MNIFECLNMELKLHLNASTTPRTRKYIKNSKKSDIELSNELGISIDTVRKWRNRDSVIDKSHRPNFIYRRLTIEQEWIIIYLRSRLRLSLDELLEVSKLLINKDLSRAVLNRCLKKYNIPRIKKPTTSVHGHVLIDMVKLPNEVLKNSSYLIVFTEIYSSFVSFALVSEFTKKSAEHLVSFVQGVLPYKIKHLTIPNYEFIEGIAKDLNVPFSFYDDDSKLSIKSDEPAIFEKDINDILMGESFDPRLGLPSILLCYEDILNKRVIRNRLKNLTPNSYLKSLRSEDI